MSDDARRPTPVLLTLALACVAFSLSQTLVVPALPSLAEEFDASPSAVSWVLTGFLVSASISTPIVGKLGDLYGKGRMLTVVLLLFSAGAVINALAGSIEVVIAGRLLQGVAGGVFPLAFGIVRDTFPREHIAGGLAMISAIFGIGGGIGLPLSGVVVDNLDLQWLFWINLIALPAAFAAHRLIPPSPPVENAKVDWLGAVILWALAGILLGVSQGSDWGWGSPANVAAIGGGLLMIGLFVVVESRVAQPLIDLQVLRRRSVAATNLTGFMVGAAMFSSFLIMPQFAQAPERTGYGFGFTVTQAGLLLMPTALAQLLAGAPAARIAARIGFRSLLSLGAVMISASFLINTFAHSHPWELVLGGILLGAGITFAFASMANLIVDAVAQSEVGIATGINTVMRTVGGSFGAAAATAILTASEIGEELPLPTEGAYTAAFAFSSVAGVFALLASRLVPRPAKRLSLEPARAGSR